MTSPSDDITTQPVGDSVDSAVEVLATKTRIRDICIEHVDVAAYLQGVSPDKREIALVHAIKVGIMEIVARRDRTRH